MKHPGMLAALILGCSLSGLAAAGHGGHAGGGARGGGHVAGGTGAFHGGGFHGGGFYGRGGRAVFVGGPLFLSTYGVGGYYYFDSYPPYSDIPAAPPVYIENGGNMTPAPVAAWYYCQNPAGYYPYVQQCQSGWQRVAPQVPPPGSY